MIDTISLMNPTNRSTRVVDVEVGPGCVMVTGGAKTVANVVMVGTGRVGVKNATSVVVVALAIVGNAIADVVTAHCG